MIPVIVIRPQPGCDATVAAASDMDLEVHGFPLFEVRPLAWEAPDPDEIDALLIGSANALRHAGAALSAFRGKPTYTVGETTAEAARAAEATAREVFEKGGMGDDLPTLTLTAADLGDGLPVVQLIARSGLAKSGKEARRLITDNGARLNDQLITDTSLIVTAADLGQPIKLSAGKKRHALVVLEG